jgi:hypothetical protein
MGDYGFLKRLKIEMRRQHRLGDTMALRGRVVRKAERDGEACVTSEVGGERREGSHAGRGDGCPAQARLESANLSARREVVDVLMTLC